MGEKRLEENREYYYSLPLNIVLLTGKIALNGTKHAEYIQELRDQERLISGRSAARVLAEGSNDDSLRLGDLLRDDKIPLSINLTVGLDIHEWPPELFIASGKWLAAVVDPTRNYRERVLNETVVSRGRKLGICPGIKQIISPERFGSMTNFYRAAEITGTHRKIKPTKEEAIEYLFRLYGELGYIPSADEINLRAAEDPSALSYQSILWVLKNPLSEARRRIGNNVTSLLSNDAIIELGADIMDANDGKCPSEDVMNLLSKNRLAPSAKTAINRFKKFKRFQQLSQEIYNERQRKLNDINDEMAERMKDDYHLVSNLFKDQDTETARLKVFAKYKLVDTLLPSATRYIKLWISTMPDNDLFDKLEVYESAIEPKRIYEVVEELGIGRILFPKNLSHLSVKRYSSV